MRKQTTYIIIGVVVIFLALTMIFAFSLPKNENNTNNSSNTTLNITNNTTTNNTTINQTSQNTTSNQQKTSTSSSSSNKKSSSSSSYGVGSSAVDSNGNIKQTPDGGDNWVINNGKWERAVTYKNGHYYDYHGLNVDHKILGT